MQGAWLKYTETCCACIQTTTWRTPHLSHQWHPKPVGKPWNELLVALTLIIWWPQSIGAKFQSNTSLKPSYARTRHSSWLCSQSLLSLSTYQGKTTLTGLWHFNLGVISIQQLGVSSGHQNSSIAGNSKDIPIKCILWVCTIWPVSSMEVLQHCSARWLIVCCTLEIPKACCC